MRAEKPEQLTEHGGFLPGTEYAWDGKRFALRSWLSQSQGYQVPICQSHGNCN